MRPPTSPTPATSHISPDSRRSRGLLVPAAVCAALVFGPVGTAAAVTDVPGTASAGTTAAWSSVGPDAVLDQLDVLDEANQDDDLAPLLDVLSAIAKHEEAGTLDPAAAGYARSLETANASLQQRLKDRAGSTTDRAAVPAADPIADLVAQLQSTVGGLVQALTGVLSGAVGTVTGLLSPVLGVVTGLLGTGLPALPDLPAAGSPATTAGSPTTVVLPAG
ncbi:hypothetical protein [Streptomyces sp. R35]|uniref:Secreted protein n=1 Tax=Streptomyces sp. R35 TaxID=3238630 RepID=A0AB39SCU8_9ACTN